MQSDATADPCPNCDQRVTSLANFCPHCGTPLSEGAEIGRATRTPGASDAGRPDASDSIRPDASDASDGPLLDPDGPVDGALTVGVAGAAGVVSGLLFAIVAAVWSQQGWTFLLGLLPLVAVGGYLSRRDSAGDALRHGCYLVGASLLFLPLIAFSPSVEGGDFGGRVLLFVVGELILGVVAALLSALGYVTTVALRR